MLKAHGHTPTWTREQRTVCGVTGGATGRSNLTFHDLRHEAGSRLLEAGWPLHNVAHMLGHTNIAQTIDLPQRDSGRITGRDAAT